MTLALAMEREKEKKKRKFFNDDFIFIVHISGTISSSSGR